MHPHIPAALQAPVNLALQAVFGTTTLDAITPLRAGLSSALVLRVVVGGRPSLLRIERAASPLLAPEAHYAAMIAAADAGLAPAVRYTDAAHGVAIIDHIDAQPLNRYPGGLPALGLALGAMVARLQRTPALPPLMEHLDGLRQIIADTLATGLIAPEAAAAPLDLWARLAERVPRTPVEERVSSHNDLNRNNVLYDGQRLWIIDWESAFANDPYVDPATLCNFFGVEGPDEDALLRAVFGEASAQRRSRLRLMRQVGNLFYAMMFMRLVAGSRAPDAPPRADLSAPPLRVVRQGLASGAVQLDRPEGQWLYATALLGEVQAAVRALG